MNAGPKFHFVNPSRLLALNVRDENPVTGKPNNPRFRRPSTRRSS